jgi:coenzyme F420-reducing hydrogenase alpha subunit
MTDGKTIKIDHMAKIYGHASLEVKIRDRRVRTCKLHIEESSRFFEHMMKGKRFDEARRLAPRICGICAASHNITAIMAVEDALGVKPSPHVRRVREALILGGYVQSHALHGYFLALPDYLGYSGILDMADKHADYVDRAFRLKRLGNAVIEVLGGRATHPVTTNIGGFTNRPEPGQIDVLLEGLKEGLEDAKATVRLFSSFQVEDFEGGKIMGALEDGDSYAILTGRPVIGGREIEPSEFLDKVRPETKSYSTSKFVKLAGREFLVGPLARINANHRFLSEEARSSLKRSKLKLPNLNPFNANIARAVEMVHCIEECIGILKAVKRNMPKSDPEPYNFRKLGKAHHGCAVTEAPRGMLYHGYTINKEGFILDSSILTPTAQNLNPIESDVRAFLPMLLGNKKKSHAREQIILDIEKLIRSYDPCISCATHFLDVKFS